VRTQRSHVTSPRAAAAPGRYVRPVHVLALETGKKFHGFSGASLAVLIAAGIAAAVWLVVFAVRWMASLPKLPSPGPETSELGAEPPAVVNMLVNRWCVTRAAVPATLVDLAARGVVGLEEVSSEEFVVRLKPHHENEPLTPYEQQVLDVVKARATGGSAPVQALDTGDTMSATAWWKRFAKAVERDTRQRGLSQNRWNRLDWIVLGGGLAVALALVAFAFGLAHLGEGVTNHNNGEKTGQWNWFAVALFIWIFGLVALASLRSIRDTRAGRAACARWLGVRKFLRHDGTFGDATPAAVTIWGRNLSYGVALGVARATATALPFGDEDPHSAWSRYGGSWHQVRVEYPKRFGYGDTPLGVFLGGVVRTIFWGFLAFAVLPAVVSMLWHVQHDVFTTTTSLMAFGFVALFVVVFGVIGVYLIAQLIDGLARLGHGLFDLGHHVDVRGAVIRAGQSGDFAGYVAIDDGHEPVTKAFKPMTHMRPMRRGDEITVTYTPHLRHVTALEVVHAVDLTAAAAADATDATPTSSAPAVAPLTGIDAATVSQIVGRPMSPAPAAALGHDGVPPGAAMSAFTDGAHGTVGIGRMPQMPKAFESIEHRLAASGTQIAIGDTGLHGAWLRDRALLVETDAGLMMVVVQLDDVASGDRRAMAVALATKALAPSTTSPA